MRTLVAYACVSELNHVLRSNIVGHCKERLISGYGCKTM